jgi:hypothetical protein
MLKICQMKRRKITVTMHLTRLTDSVSLFCLPGKLALTNEQLDDIMKRWAEKQTVSHTLAAVAVKQLVYCSCFGTAHFGVRLSRGGLS